jgi:hypothetical protein
VGVDYVGETVTLNVCQAGHTFHESKQVETMYGSLNIWQWDRYMDFPNYCPGQDEVSKSIDLQQVWEQADTAYFVQVLEDQSGVVLDFGSHIGWFTTLAARFECMVYAFDADPENMRLLKTNVDIRRRKDYAAIYTTTGWVSDLSSQYFDLDHVRLFKSDLEGHEHEALNLTRHLWQNRKVDYGLWELSPIFENREGINAPSYADLVDEIASYGYRWFILKDEGEWEITGADLTFPQENAWAERLP